MLFTSTFPMTARERFLVSRTLDPPEGAAESGGMSWPLDSSARSSALACLLRWFIFACDCV